MCQCITITVFGLSRPFRFWFPALLLMKIGSMFATKQQTLDYQQSFNLKAQAAFTGGSLIHSWSSAILYTTETYYCFFYKMLYYYVSDFKNIRLLIPLQTALQHTATFSVSCGLCFLKPLASSRDGLRATEVW